MSTVDLREQDRMRTASTSQANMAMAAATGGGVAEALCGLAVIALAIAGLAGAYPALLAGVAVIVFGAGLLCGDGAMVTYFTRVSARRSFNSVPMPFSGGLGAEALGGIAGIVLGILTLVGVEPLVLTAVSVLVFGACVIMGGAARVRLMMRTVARPTWTEEETAAFQEASGAAVGGRALVGLAAVVLGIIAIVFSGSAAVAGTSLVLTLVALLCLGAGAVLTGSTFGSQAAVTTPR
jgi:hypothetical protein